MTHRRGNWMESTVTSTGVTAVPEINSCESLSALISRFFMSISYVWNLWHRILTAVQVDAYNIDNTSDWCLVACMLAVQSYNSSAITHPIIHYSTQSCNHTHMITVPMILPSPTFITNTINPSGNDSFQSPYTITSELSMPTFTLTHHSPAHFHYLLSSTVHLIRETTPPAKQIMHTLHPYNHWPIS
jgi:hypothetical protein